MNRQDAFAEVLRLIKHGYHGSAISLIKKELATDGVFVHEVAQWYVDRGQWYTFSGYEHLLRAYELVPLGLSRSIRERLLTAFVKWGFHKRAEELAAGLGRVLTVEEIQSLVSYYINGTMLSHSTERELRALAWETGGELLEGSVRRSFDAMHERFDWKPLLK